MSEYEDLAQAIIVQAAKDYREYYKKLDALLNTETRGMNEEARWRYNKMVDKAQAAFDEVVSFFHSEWYTILTDVDASVILQKLNEECGIE